MPRRLPSGRWQGQIRVGKRRVSPGHSFELKKQARAWEEDERRKLRRGEWRDPKLAQELFEDWCARWMASRNVEPETAADDARTLARLVLPRWRGLPLGAPGRLEVQSWVTAMGQAGVGYASVVKAYGLFAGAMAAAEDEGVLARTPCRKIDLGEAPAHQLRYWEPAHMDWILANLAEPHAAVAALMCWCGLRWEEAAALPADAVNWLRREISVVQVVTSARRIKLYAKNGDPGHRTVRMEGPVAAMLRPAWQAAVDARGESGLVWVAPDGRPLLNRTWGEHWRARIRIFHPVLRPAGPEPGRPWGVVRGYGPKVVAWHRTEEQAEADAACRRREVTGAPYYSPHTLRHTGASWLAQAGVTLADIGLWLGHGPGSSATAVYAHLRPERSNATIGEALAAVGKPVGEVDTGEQRR
jgi:integrase